LVAASLCAVVAPSTAASADPGDTTSTADDGDDDPLLNEVLDSTGRRYLTARAAVAKSTKTQLQLAIDVKTAEARRDDLKPEVDAVAAQQYRTGNVSAASFLLSSVNSDDFLKKAILLEEISALNDGKLKKLNDAIAAVSTAKAHLDTEVKAQKQNLALMQKQKDAAEKALALVGGESLTGGFVLSKSPVAAPAPRNSDGGFSPEACTVGDPTTGGCITARTLHMFKEVKKAGFSRFVGCHRDGGPFEHPKGRACDWSLQDSGFSVAHNADMKNYGNNVMAFLVRNADRLGILYVIWYAQIWFPATGWKAYHGPSSHKDHVHVSML
jgi:hypothetical protein